jgi:hypothetical protein
MVGRFDPVKQGDLSGQDETPQGKVVLGRPHKNGLAVGPHRGRTEQTNRCTRETIARQESEYS